MTADVVDLATRCCLGGGWVVATWSSVPTVRPCPVHRADQHARWAGGEFEPRRPVYVEPRAHLAIVK